MLVSYASVSIWQSLCGSQFLLSGTADVLCCSSVARERDSRQPAPGCRHASDEVTMRHTGRPGGAPFAEWTPRPKCHFRGCARGMAPSCPPCPRLGAKGTTVFDLCLGALSATSSSRAGCRREMWVAQGAPLPQQKQFRATRAARKLSSGYEFGQRCGKGWLGKGSDITVFRLETAARGEDEQNSAETV